MNTHYEEKVIRETTADNTLKYYSVSVYCENCGKHDTVYVKKGWKKQGLTTTCSDCECSVVL